MIYLKYWRKNDENEEAFIKAFEEGENILRFIIEVPDRLIELCNLWAVEGGYLQKILTKEQFVRHILTIYFEGWGFMEGDFGGVKCEPLLKSPQGEEGE